MISIFALSFLLNAAPETAWKKVDEQDGTTVESRPIEGSKCAQLRATAVSPASVEQWCKAAFGDGKLDRDDPDLKDRKVLSESENERVTYDHSSPPLVSDRDYVIKAVRTFETNGDCRVTFAAANELAPPLPKNWVRIEQLKGYWDFKKRPDGNTQIEYVIHTDPAGSIPTFMVEGARVKTHFRWMKLMKARAEKMSRENKGASK
jgi:hypothetical protein